MNRQKLTELVNYPERISQKDAALLEDMAAQYPYTTVIQILLAKSKQTQADAREALATAALYTPNRPILRQVMENTMPPLKLASQAVDEQHKQDTPAFDHPTKNPKSSEQGALPAAEFHKEAFSETTDSIASESIDSPASYVLTQHEDTPLLSLVPDQDQSHSLVDPDNPPAPSSDIFEELQQNLRRLREEKVKWQSERKMGEQVSPPAPNQSAGLASNTGQHPQKPAVHMSPAIQQVVDDHQQQPLENPKVQEQRSLIDSFLQNAASLQRKKTDAAALDEDIADLSEQVTASSLDLATETLAIIMEKQGKTEKAIDIYEKLLLKYPEKSAYFASCIERLKKDL